MRYIKGSYYFDFDCEDFRYRRRAIYLTDREIEAVRAAVAGRRERRDDCVFSRMRKKFGSAFMRDFKA